MIARQGGLFRTIVARPVGFLVAFTTLIVIGVIAYRSIPIQLVPDGWSEPSLWAWIPNPGSSARENEEQVARVVEEQLRTVSGIEEIRSWSRRDVVEFGLRFVGNIDMNLAKAEVRDRIERAWPSLPSTAETAQIWSESSDQIPITFFGVKLQGDPLERDRLMERVIIPRLEATQGIGRVAIWGMQEDSVRILLDEDKVRAAGLDLGPLIMRLASDNFALPLGDLEDGGRELMLRSDMRFRSPEEIAKYPVGNGLTLADLGRVARVKEIEDHVARIDGGYAYFGFATKDSQSNVVEVSRSFRAATEELEKDPALDGEVAFLVFFLQGDAIEFALAQMQNTAWEGGFLAVAILLIFLRRLRLTLVVALSIPVSALLAIAFEYFTGGTFNLLTMTGITLSIGMLVDNAVVVVENIVRLRREGRSPLEAASVGTREIALAVTLATLTSVVVIAPLIFMTNSVEARLIFGGLGIPYSIALLASLLVALIFTPVIVARMLGERSRRGNRWTAAFAPLLRAPARAVAWLIAGLRAVWFGWVRLLFRLNRMALAVLVPLRWPLALLLVGLAAWGARSGMRALATTQALAPFLDGLAQPTSIVVTNVVFGLIALALLVFVLPRCRRRPARPPARPASFVPAGTSLIDMTIDANQRLLGWTLRHRLLAVVIGFCTMCTIAVPASHLEMGVFGDDNSSDAIEFRVRLDGRFTLEESEKELRPYEEFLESKKADYGFAHWSNHFDEDDGELGLYFDVRRTGDEIEALEKRLQDELPRIPGHRLRFYQQNQSDGRTKTVARFTLLGPDSDELERLGTKAAKILEGVPGLSQVSSPLDQAPDEIEVSSDRDLAHERGVDSRTVENSIAYALSGFPLPRFQEEGREIPLVIEYDGAQNAGMPTLADLSVFGAEGAVPLSTLASLGFSKGRRTIFRRDGKTSFTLEAKVDDPLRILPVSSAGLRALQEIDLPRGSSIDIADTALNRQEAEFGELLNALFFGMALVFLLMAIMFESLLLPFAVAFTIPFALLGSAWAVWLSGTQIDIMGLIGVILLIGVVVNNGIVLIDRVHNLRGETKDRTTAVLLGSAQRVRPVLMTALATVVGLLPMMLAPPPRNGIDYRPLAMIVAGGLTVSTVFTLWVVPLAYTLIDDLAHALSRWLRWWVHVPRRLFAGSRARTEPAS